MSLTYLKGNQFNYQDIPANAIVYRSGTSGFETIQQEQGVLMSDGSTYSFGIPTAAELVRNYTGNNSLIMTENNNLVEVPIEGTSPNKLLRYVNNAWKIVDFSVEYIKPELYNPSSWQLWIADSDINVINIPKESINNNIWGVRYNTTANQFNVYTPVAYDLAISEVTIPYMYGTNYTDSFTRVYNNAIIYSNTNSSDSSLYTVFYSSQKSEIFNGVINNYIDEPTSIIKPEMRENVLSIFLYGGLLIENYNDYTSNAVVVSIITDGTTSITTSDTGVLRNVSQCIKLQNGNVILPAEIVCFTNKTGITFTNPFKIYSMIQTDPQDTAVYHWYYPRNYMNMYIRNAGN